MNNPNSCNPDTDYYVQNLSEDEPGFNYSTYPTAEVATPKDTEVATHKDNLIDGGR